MEGRCVAWIVLGILTTTIAIIVLATLVGQGENEWCNESLKAGDCEMYMVDQTLAGCYCIQMISQNSDDVEIGLRANAISQCSLLNGSLAVTDNSELVVWLAKRMYPIGANTALVNLQKIDENWYWLSEDSQIPAQSLNWRPDVPLDPHHINAVLNVETIKVEAGDDYSYYNYDSYIDGNKDIQWYGFSTVGNAMEGNEEMSLICNYDTPPVASSDDNDTPSGKQTENTLPDPCTCNTEGEAITLENLEDTHEIHSPGYPSNYCIDMDYKWIVHTTEGLIIKLEWLVFKTEKTYDFVFVYDGDGEKSPLLERCTGITCANHKSSSASLQIHFESDHVTTDMGFSARVTAIDPETTDFVYIYGHRNTETPNLETADHVCNGKDCENLILSAYELGPIVDVHFISDAQSTINTRRFSGEITVVKTYCDKADLVVPPLGSLSYSQQRSDVKIPLLANATLNCPPKTKIINSFDRRTDVATCMEIGTWDKILFEDCVPACPITYTTREADMSDLYLCKFSEKTGLSFTKNQENVTVEHYNKRGVKTGSKSFTCSDTSKWEPKPPTCHSSMSGILITGSGPELDGYRPGNIEIYSPLEGTSKLLSVTFQYGRRFHVSAVLPNGRVLVAGGSDMHDSRPYIIDIYREEIVETTYMIVRRSSASAAVINGIVYICGGSTYGDTLAATDRCESYHNDKFHDDVPTMKNRREGLALVALNGYIYALGGMHCIQNHDCVQYWNDKAPYEMAHTAEKLLIGNDAWDFIPDMQKRRAHLAASVLDGMIYACGGGDEVYVAFWTCERFNPSDNKWITLTSEMERGREEFMLVTYHGKLYAIGSRWMEDNEKFENYDKEKDQWTLETTPLFVLSDDNQGYGSAVVIHDF